MNIRLKMVNIEKTTPSTNKRQTDLTVISSSFQLIQQKQIRKKEK